MRCFSAINVKGRYVPCRQCINCRINSGRKWSARILMEQAQTKRRSAFVTLTYREEDLPDENGIPTLRKKYFRKWIQNVQSGIGPFRYFAVGEYGEKYGRPHYHLAIFPTTGPDPMQVARQWKKGDYDVRELVEARARYLASYTTKKLVSPDDERLAPNQEPEFRISSRRPPLGHDHLEEIISWYRSEAGKQHLRKTGDVERTIRLGGHLYPLDEWSLRKLRRSLGIDEKHSERLCDPVYFYNDIFKPEAEGPDSRKAEIARKNHAIKEKRKQEGKNL